MDKDLRQLHMAFLDLAGMLNEPQRDDALIAEAGISLDRALFGKGKSSRTAKVKG